jgi:hypothetical protein
MASLPMWCTSLRTELAITGKMQHPDHPSSKGALSTVLLQEWLVICDNEPDSLEPRLLEACDECTFPVHMTPPRED